MSIWKKYNLNDLCRKITDGSHNPPKGIEFGEFLMLSSKNIFNDDINYDNPRYLNEEDYISENKRTQVEFDDILLTIVGTIGRVAVVPEYHIPFTLQRSVAVLKPKFEMICSRFLMYSLQNILEQLVTESRGVAQKGIYLKQLREIEIYIPSLKEQQQIVAILDQAFAAINQAKANIEKNIHNAKELFQSKLNETFSQEVEGWRQTTLGVIYDVRDGTHDSPKYIDEGYPLVTSKNLKQNKISYDNVKYISEKDYNQINKRSKVDIGDVIFAMIGTIGNPVVITTEPNFAIKNVALFKVSQNHDSEFLRFYLEFVVSHMISQANGSTQQFVGLGYLRNYPINIPDLKRQKEVVSILNQLENYTNNLIDKYKIRQEMLENLKKSIMQKAFAGELKLEKVNVA